MHFKQILRLPILKLVLLKFHIPNKTICRLMGLSTCISRERKKSNAVLLSVPRIGLCGNIVLNKLRGLFISLFTDSGNIKIHQI